MGCNSTFTCDVCGAEKREANRWFMALQVGLVLRPGGPVQPQISITHFDPIVAQRTSEKCLCGEACTLKFISQNLASLVV